MIPPASSMPKTILIIDDFASVRLYHMSFLARKGYRCIGAGDGNEALARLHGDHIDLILLDMVMPGMDGGEFLNRLDREPGCAGIPVLAITSESPLAQAVADDSRRSMHVLSKPVMPDALLTAVRELLPQTETAESLPAL